MHEADIQAKKVFGIIDSCFDIDPSSKEPSINDLTVSAYEGADQLGPKGAQALEYGLMPHLKTIMAKGGASAEELEQLTDYLQCWASLTDKLYAGKPQDHYRHEGHRVLATLGSAATRPRPIEYLG
jgi:hypothetical protein